MGIVKHCLILSFLVVFAGCKTTAWYQPGKTLTEAAKDCEECKYEVMKFSNPYSKPQTEIGYFVGQDTELLMQCMKIKGYIWADVTNEVKSGSLRLRSDPFNGWYSVAGP